MQYQLQGTNTFLVGSGREKVLIDTGEGVPVWVERIAEVIEKHGFAIKAVLLTHWHGDHTGGVPDLVKLYPQLSSAIYKNSPDAGQLPIEDKQMFRVDGASVRALFTPGHAVDHMCFVLEEENALFTGDNVLGHGFTVIEDLGLYMSTLDIMEGQGCTKGYPAHGIVIENLPSKLLEYKVQQLGREKKILEALRLIKEKQSGNIPSGRYSVTVAELVRAIYGDVTEGFSKAALEPSVNEVLGKLAEDRKVAFVFIGGAKRWFATVQK